MGKISSKFMPVVKTHSGLSLWMEKTVHRIVKLSTNGSCLNSFSMLYSFYSDTQNSILSHSIPYRRLSVATVYVTYMIYDSSILMVLDIDCPYLLMGGTILALWYFCLRLLHIPANPKGEKQAYYKA